MKLRRWIIAGALAGLVSAPGLAAQPTPTAPPAPVGAGDDADEPDAGADEPDADADDPAPPAAPAPIAPKPPPPELTGAAKQAYEAGELIEQGDLGGAEQKIRLALEVDSNSPDALYQQGRLRYLRGELTPALQSVNMALSTAPTHGGALLLLIRIQGRQGTVQQSVSRLSALANQHRDDIGVQLAYGEVQLATDKHPGALAAATRVLKLSETSTAAMKLLARTYLALGRPAAAEYVLDEARKRASTADPEVLTLLAGLRHREGKLVQARLLLEEATGRAPAYVEALNSLGAIYNEVRNYEAAADTLQRVVALAPTFASGWLNLGTSQRGLGQFETAESSWKRAIQLDSEMGEAWFNLGVLYLENPIEGRDRIRQLTDATNAFAAYKRSRPPSEPLDPVAEKYAADARTLIEQEQERRKEQLKAPPESDEDAGEPSG